MREPGVLVIHNRYRQAGGEDAVVRAEVALLRGHGHGVTEFARDNASIDCFSPARKAALAFRATWNHEVYTELRRLIRTERPAVAHCHNLMPLISQAAFYACREEGVPVVQTLHNFRMLCPAGTMYRDGKVCRDCANGLRNGIARGCYRGSRVQTAVAALTLMAHRAVKTFERMVDAYSAPSVFCAERVAVKCIPREKITVRPNFLLNDPGARLSSGDCALFVGRICEEKGVRQLLKAWRRLPHIPLVMVGNGPLHQEMQRMAPRNVTFAGVLANAETTRWMKAARFLVFPSIGYETFGMAVLEAAACGVPTIGARLGAVPELLQEGQTGLLFDPHNIQELVERVEWGWSHPANMDEMGAAARRKYQLLYTADRGYESLMKLYGSVGVEIEPSLAKTGAVA